jgi:hypothetical protein
MLCVAWLWPVRILLAIASRPSSAWLRGSGAAAVCCLPLLIAPRLGSLLVAGIALGVGALGARAWEAVLAKAQGLGMRVPAKLRRRR